MYCVDNEIKKTFRKQSLRKLRSLAKRSTYHIDKVVVAALYREIKMQKVKQCLLYVPLELEVNIRPLIQQLRGEGIKVYVPYVDGVSFHVVPFRLPLRKNGFGIWEPRDSRQYRVKKIDVAVVPIVGVDSTLRRVGFGKGMYDRFYEKYGENIGKTLFTARHLHYATQCVTNHYDISASHIVTFNTLRT
jgi:5-formyltetrahydrofolate cyclo-ligase